MKPTLNAVALALLMLPAFAHALPAPHAAPEDAGPADARDIGSDCGCDARVRKPSPRAAGEPHPEKDGAFRDIGMDGKIFRR